MFGIGTQEVIFIILIALLFFGGKNIPELMKGFPQIFVFTDPCIVATHNA